VQLPRVVAVVHDLTLDDQLVLVVDHALHVVAGDGLTRLRQQPCVLVGRGQLGLATSLQPLGAGLDVRALRLQRRDLISDSSTPAVASASACVRTAPLIAALLPGIIGLKRLRISLDIGVDRCQIALEPLAGLDARLAGVAVEKRPVDRHQRSADEIELPGQHDERPVRGLQGARVGLTELGDGAVAGP
jgi:hypothetical protein